MKVVLKLNHKKLDVWQESMQLVKMTYRLTSVLPIDERFGLVSQINRASVSILSNISEGSSRSSKLERKRFYEIARSSLVEVVNHMIIAKELGFLTDSNFSEIDLDINELFA